MEMIEEADRDGDGEINEEEFLRIMKKTNLVRDIAFLSPAPLRNALAHPLGRFVPLLLPCTASLSAVLDAVYIIYIYI